jgi:hypothetical protein
MSLALIRDDPSPESSGGDFYPLDDFYAQAGRTLPLITAVSGENVPEPQRSLLVHQRDMTSTLERFHGGRVHLRLLRKELIGDFYFRQVLLVTDEGGKAVEFGAIKIDLSLFEPGARGLIVEAHLPLGRILQERNIFFSSSPLAFFKIESDAFINERLGLTGKHELFGRRNCLRDREGRALAEIVEILPP